MKHTFKLSNWNKPTPKIWLKIGNTLLGVSVFVSGYSFFNEHEYIGILGISTGVLGTVLTKFFTAE